MDYTMDEFGANGFTPIERDGQTIYPMFTHPLAPGMTVTVRWVSVNSPRVQGLDLSVRLPGVTGKKGRGGELQVEESQAPAIYLWHDTAPAEVHATCVKAAPGAELWVSNRWRTESGREDSWYNNWGILIEETAPGTYLLRCSDGVGETLTFDDLVVEISLSDPVASGDT